MSKKDMEMPTRLIRKASCPLPKPVPVETDDDIIPYEELERMYWDLLATAEDMEETIKIISSENQSLRARQCSDPDDDTWSGGVQYVNPEKRTFAGITLELNPFAKKFELSAQYRDSKGATTSIGVNYGRPKNGIVPGRM